MTGVVWCYGCATIDDMVEVTILYSGSYHGIFVVVIVCDMEDVNGVMFDDMTGAVMSDVVLRLVR